MSSTSSPSSLTLTIYKAKDLFNSEKPGQPVNSYCLITSSFNREKYKTSRVRKSNNPEWNEYFQLDAPTVDGHIFIKIYDRDSKTKTETFIGEVCIDMENMKTEENSNWYPIEGADKDKKKSKGKSLGQLKIKIVVPFYTKESKSIGSGGLEEKYELGKELGRGGFSIVREAKNLESNQLFAVKIIPRNQGDEELEVLKREIDIMQKLKHKNIIQLYEVFEDTENIYLVLEYVTSGELFDHIISKGTYSEKDAANIIKQILEAVNFMHKNGIAHRDLKPENILITGDNNDIIKVSDFGLSKDFSGAEKLKTACGTPDYVAPEVLRGSVYDHSVDVWSVGVICYILLCGFPPFYGNNEQQIFDKILRGDFDFPSPDWDNISDDAQEFVSALLTKNPRERPSAEQCLEAPWIVNQAPSTPLTNRDNFIDKMTEYSDLRKRTANTVYELPNQ